MSPDLITQAISLGPAGLAMVLAWMIFRNACDGSTARTRSQTSFTRRCADRANKIRARIGNPPDTDLGIKGSGLEADLAAFYSDRDRDEIPRISLERTLENF
jgi:hypothetical protein